MEVLDGLSDGVELGLDPAAATLRGQYLDIYGHRVWHYPPAGMAVCKDHANVNAADGKPTLPTDPDSDDDGVPDGLEDLDQDGCTDAGELDPTKLSTDGDPLPDGLELLVNGIGSVNFFGQFLDLHREGFTSELSLDIDNPLETDPLDAYTDDGNLPGDVGDGAMDGYDLNPRADDVFAAVEFGEFYTYEACDRRFFGARTHNCEFYVKDLTIKLPLLKDNQVVITTPDDGAAVDYNAVPGNLFPTDLIEQMADHDNLGDFPPAHYMAAEATWKVMRAGTGRVFAIQLPNSLLSGGLQNLDPNNQKVVLELTLADDDANGDNDIDLDDSTGTAAIIEIPLLPDWADVGAGVPNEQSLASFRFSIDAKEAAYFQFHPEEWSYFGTVDQHFEGSRHNEDAYLGLRLGDNLPKQFLKPAFDVAGGKVPELPSTACWGTPETCVG